MAARSAEVEDYKIACDMDECRWEYRRVGSSKWEPLAERDHNTLETAHILRESRALIRHFGGGYHSQTIVDMQRHTFSAGYGSSYEVRRIVLYTPEEIVSRHNKQLVQQFTSNPRAKAFADQLFDEFKNEPDSDDSDSEDESEEELIEEKLKEFLTAIGIDAASIQPAILFWQMNVKGFMEVTREELYLFLQKSGAGSMEAVRAATQKLTALVSADKAFASFYMWNFHYYRSAQEESKKFIPVATAGQVWAQVLVPRYPEVLKHLGSFMEQYKGIGISQDTWKMMLDFSKNTKPDLSNLADFYPPFIDEFVEYLVANHGYRNPLADEENDDDDDDFF